MNHVFSTVTPLASLGGFISRKLLQSPLQSMKNLSVNSIICITAVTLSLLVYSSPKLYIQTQPSVLWVALYQVQDAVEIFPISRRHHTLEKVNT